MILQALYGHGATLLTVLVPVLHVLLVPYTKVEESFSLHAVHDLLTRPWSQIAHFDHVAFPGAVPRSFIGPILLASLSPEARVLNGKELLLCIRITLALLNAASVLVLAASAKSAFSKRTSSTFLWLWLSGFHLPFWSGRTVPNFLAMPFVNVALALLLQPPAAKKATIGQRVTSNRLLALGLLLAAAMTLRLELIVLAGLWGLQLLRFKEVNFLRAVAILGAAATALVGATVAVDSYFWQKPKEQFFWPELNAVIFNVVEGQASTWGTSPWHHYFTRDFPKLLLLSYPLSAFSFFVDARVRRFYLPFLAYAAVMSLIGHKEWRFVSYAVPPALLAAASAIEGVGAMFTKRRRALLLVFVVSLNLALTVLGVWASSLNYPGGEALQVLPRLSDEGLLGRPYGPLRVHLDEFTCGNGASNLLHPTSSGGDDDWAINKAEGLSAEELDRGFDVLLTGPGTENEPFWESWELVQDFEMFGGFALSSAGLVPRLREGVRVWRRRR